jgi:hypothetical protein
MNDLTIFYPVFIILTTGAMPNRKTFASYPAA